MAPDNPSTPTPTPPDKHRASPGEINRKWLDEIALGEIILGAIGDPDYPDRPTKLNADLGDDTIQKLTDASALARTLGEKIINGKAAITTAAIAERNAMSGLLAGIHPIHNKVKKVYSGNKEQAKVYRIGKKSLGDNRDQDKEDFPTIIDTAEKDTALSIPTAVIGTARTALKTWTDAVNALANAETAVTDLLTQLENTVNGINRYRRDVQLSADSVWPHDNPASAATRRAFKLPANRAMS